MAISQSDLRTYLNFMSRVDGPKVTDMNGREWSSQEFAARKGYSVESIVFLPAFTMICEGDSTREFPSRTTFNLDGATINEQTSC